MEWLNYAFMVLILPLTSTSFINLPDSHYRASLGRFDGESEAV